ncbi:hypothetical protein QDA03_gp29 [Microbacterium phage Terij]|uniref:Uncharacterized protein n=1 Tax=Microbacterium phage Terij TaxID=2686229 RepID=A0A6B9L6J0_9CAUD|nr:hypothetical protein QDA03_gp29 [Microbacterium phage Terij]QHB37212.1 hypothetical protein SEA_TERIJ_78 [Microbacterium phage Terij]
MTPEPNPARFPSRTITTKGKTMKRLIAGGASALLLAGGIVAASVAPASAHTPAASATCEAITISASYYETKPTKGEPTIANPDYKPAVPGTPAVGEPTMTVPNPDYKPAAEAVYATEYEYQQIITGKTKWLDSKTWNPGLGWFHTGNTRQVEVSPATEAVGEPTITVPNPAYVPATPGTPAQGEPTIPNPAYQAGDATPNTVTVTVDGTQVYSERFGTSHTATIPLDGTTKHSWVASFVGWNGIGTQTITGKTTACPPTGITVPALTVTPPTCNADGSLPFLGNPAAQNPNGYEFPGQGFRVYLDRAFDGAGTYTATLQKVGPGFDPAFPYGTKITGGDTTQTLTVLPATGYQADDPEAPCYVNVPEPVVTTGEWSTPEIDCTAEEGDEVAITRTVTTTTSTLNPTTGTVTTETTEATEEGTYTVTAEDIEALDCPVPPTEEPEEPTTPEEPTDETPAASARTASVTTTGDLAETGANPAVTLWALTGGAVAVAFGALAVVLGLRRRQVAGE